MDAIDKITSKTLLFLMLVLMISCQEWTPQATGYYIIDGEHYKVHVLTVRNESFPQPWGSNIIVNMQGAPAFNVSMFVTVPSYTLTDGTYHVSEGYEMMGINYISFLTGLNSESLTADKDSEGVMTVKISGQNYVLDFDGNIEGHRVQMHYSGLASIQ